MCNIMGTERSHRLLWIQTLILLTFHLVAFIDCSCSSRSARFHVLPSSMSKCHETTSVWTNVDCAIKTGNSSAICTLCFDLETMTSAAENIDFLLPYTHRVYSPIQEISIPCVMRAGFAIFISAIPQGRGGVFIIEQKCNDHYDNNCFFDFFFDVRFDLKGTPISFNKRYHGVWGFETIIANNGTFAIGQRFQLVLAVTESSYRMIVDVNEFTTVPKGPEDISSTAKVASSMGISQDISFYCPASC